MSYLMHTGRKGMKWGQHIFGGEDKYRRKATRAAANTKESAKRYLDARKSGDTSEAKRALRDNKKYNKQSLKYIRKADKAAAVTKNVIKILDSKPAVKDILNNPGSQQHSSFMYHVNQQSFQNMMNNSAMIANQNLSSFMNMTVMTNNMALHNTMMMPHF